MDLFLSFVICFGMWFFSELVSVLCSDLFMSYIMYLFMSFGSYVLR